jgi:phage-related holin
MIAENVLLYYIAQLKANWVLKGVHGVVGGFLAFLFDIELAVLYQSLATLMFIDFFLAVYHSLQVKKFEWRKMRVTAKKFLVYFGMISAGHLVEVSLAQSIHFIDNTVIAYLAIHEFFSIMGHASNMGFSTPKKFLRNLSDQFEKKYGK